MIFSTKNVSPPVQSTSPVHQSSPLVQSSDCRLPCQSLQLVIECVYRPCMHVNNRTWRIKRETSVFTWPTLTLTNSQCGCMPTGHALYQISRPSPARFSAISIAFSAASDKRWDKNLHGYEALCVSVHPIRLCIYGQAQ